MIPGYRNLLVLVLLVLGLQISCGPSEEDLPIYIKQLKSQESSVRNKAALSLAKFGADGEKAVPALIKLLSDKNGGVRSSAAYALRSIDTPQARRALDDYKK